MNFRHFVAAAALLASTTVSAQAIDVAFGGTRRVGDTSPIALDGFVAFDPATPGVPFNGQVQDFTPVANGRLDVSRTLDASGAAGPVRSFDASRLSFTYSRIADSLGIRVRVDPETLGAGEYAELSFGNAEGSALTFPAYTASAAGFTTANFRYSLAGIGTGAFFTNLSNRASAPATPVPEPAPLALFVLALAALGGAWRKRLARVRVAPPAAPNPASDPALVAVTA